MEYRVWSIGERHGGRVVTHERPGGSVEQRSNVSKGNRRPDDWLGHLEVGLNGPVSRVSGRGTIHRALLKRYWRLAVGGWEHSKAGGRGVATPPTLGHHPAADTDTTRAARGAAPTSRQQKQKGRPQAPTSLTRYSILDTLYSEQRPSRLGRAQPPIDFRVTRYSMREVNSSTVRPAARPAGIID